ncbi:MAG TPA: cyclodeaminase/cyclohydrolase family protein [Candidatus Dormibacteraeota bacterium]|jgi:formiminotetrahydrofolate cyclodeaminase|nr:cyclodeaminase/cyclohydrolase family protein [Candidatus Dormibacteraeota bacterium]
MTAVKDQTVAEYLQGLRSTAAVPGGGSAAALAAAMGVGLVSMVAKLSARKAKDDHDRALLTELVPRLDELSVRLIDLSQQDIDAYRAVIDARKSAAGVTEMERAYEQAAEVPLSTAIAAGEAIDLALQVSERAWDMTASDLAVGNDLLQAGKAGALGNVAINLPELKGETAARIERRYQQLLGARR